MSTTDPARSRPTVQQYPSTGGSAANGYPSEDTASGWLTYAGVMLVIAGTLNIIDGVAAVSNSTFFTENAKYVISSLNTLGWVLIVLGVGQCLTALGVWAQTKGVRWVGVAFASANAIVQLLFIPAYPFWSLCVFTLDMLVIYGLIVHGKRADA